MRIRKVQFANVPNSVDGFCNFRELSQTVDGRSSSVLYVFASNENDGKTPVRLNDSFCAVQKHN